VAASITEIKSLARAYTEKAVQTLGGIMSQADCPPAARVAAAIGLLDRGWGKPAQAHVGGDEDDPAIKVDQNITVKIVDPAGGK
jgi:hypothetical protein